MGRDFRRRCGNGFGGAWQTTAPVNSHQYKRWILKFARKASGGNKNRNNRRNCNEQLNFFDLRGGQNYLLKKINLSWILIIKTHLSKLNFLICRIKKWYFVNRSKCIFSMTATNRPPSILMGLPKNSLLTFIFGIWVNFQRKSLQFPLFYIKAC